MRHPDLLKRVREGIVADIVQERGGGDDLGLVARDLIERPRLAQVRDGATGEMVSPKRVLEAGVRGPGIHEMREAELPNVAQALHRRGVQELLRGGVHADVVPQGVADEGHAWNLGGRGDNRNITATHEGPTRAPAPRPSGIAPRSALWPG